MKSDVHTRLIQTVRIHKQFSDWIKVITCGVKRKNLLENRICCRELNESTEYDG